MPASCDADGNWGEAAHYRIKIDRTGPRTYARNNPTARRYRYVTLRYKVTDGRSTNAKVTIKIYRKGRRKLTLRPGWRGTNNLQRWRFKCRLSRGLYVYKVYGVDQAGNPQRIIGRGKLTVR